MFWMSVVFAEAKAFQKAIVIVMETLPMSAAFAAVAALQKELVIAMALCLPMATIALAFA
jgi:hypothetical protein